MRKVSFLLLLGLAIAFVAAAGYSLARGDLVEVAPPPSQRAFPGLADKLGDLAWMRLSRGALSIDFAAIGGSWAVVEKSNYPAAPARVRSLLLGLADLTLIEPKTERPDRFARLDLDAPENGRSTLVALQDRAGKRVAELIVGKIRHDRLGGRTDGTYVRKPGADQTWLARGALDTSGDIRDWLDRRIVDLPAARFASIILNAADGSELALRRDAADGKFAVVDAPADAKFKDSGSLAAPATALAKLDLDDVRPAAELPVPDSGTDGATFTCVDGLMVTLRLFPRDKAEWVAITVSGTQGAEGEAKALNARLSRWVFAIPAERARLLRTRLSDLLEPQKGS